MLNKLVISIAILFISSHAFAGLQTARGTISQLYIYAGDVHVMVTGVEDNDGCESTHYYALKPTTTGFEQMYSALLAAQMSNKKVKFWISGCGGQFDKYPNIISVWVDTQ